MRLCSDSGGDCVQEIFDRQGYPLHDGFEPISLNGPDGLMQDGITLAQFQAAETVVRGRLETGEDCLCTFNTQKAPCNSHPLLLCVVSLSNLLLAESLPTCSPVTPAEQVYSRTFARSPVFKTHQQSLHTYVNTASTQHIR